MKNVGLILAALAINMGLFVLMESMVSRNRVRVVNLVDTQPIEFIRTQMDEETRTRDRRSPPPPKPQEIERPRADVENIAERVSAFETNVTAFEVASLLGEGGGVAVGQSLALGTAAGMDLMMADDLIPLTMLPPQYPASARIREIEGWVDLLFTVTAQGTVSDPVVTDSQPLEIFDRAAMDAASRWRFRPVTRDGEAVDILAQIRINFSLQGQ